MIHHWTVMITLYSWIAGLDRWTGLHFEPNLFTWLWTQAHYVYSEIGSHLWGLSNLGLQDAVMYQSLVKECPPPTFCQISFIAAKFTEMNAHSGGQRHYCKIVLTPKHPLSSSGQPAAVHDGNNCVQNHNIQMVGKELPAFLWYKLANILCALGYSVQC